MLDPLTFAENTITMPRKEHFNKSRIKRVDYFHLDGGKETNYKIYGSAPSESYSETGPENIIAKVIYVTSSFGREGKSGEHLISETFRSKVELKIY